MISFAAFAHVYNVFGDISTVSYEGRIATDPSRPDGMMRKLMDVSRLKRLGWEATIPLEAGIRSTYDWFLEQGLERLRAK